MALAGSGIVYLISLIPCVCVCSRYRSALLILGTSLRSLGLYSLTSVLNGRVLLAFNRHLCFVNTVDWPQITNYRRNSYISRDDYTDCGKFSTFFCTVCVAVVLFLLSLFVTFKCKLKQQSLANAKVSARQQRVYEGPLAKKSTANERKFRQSYPGLVL